MRRQQEIEIQKKRQLNKAMTFLIKIALSILGVTVFTVLPNVLAEESGQSDLVAGISKSIGGIVLVFLGHWTISILIKSILLSTQHKTYLEQLELNMRENSGKSLSVVFYQHQLKYLKQQEEELSKSPGWFHVSFSLVASLAEIGGVIYIFTQGRASDEPVNFFLMFIVSIVPLFTLWAMSFVSAYYDHVPKEGFSPFDKYYQRQLEIEKLFSDKYLEGDTGEGNPEYFLNKMSDLWLNEREKKELVINYVLSRVRLEDNRHNELILTEGEIDYYSTLKRILMSENLKRLRLTDSLNESELISHKQSRELTPQGEGGVPYLNKKDEAQKISQQARKSKRDDEMANDLISQCSVRIDELKEKMVKLVVRHGVSDKSI